MTTWSESGISMPRNGHAVRQMAAVARVPIRIMPEVIAVMRRHQDITEVFRLMRERLGLTLEFCDDVGGLAKGHTDKILGPSEVKNWGATTFDLFCEMFAIEFRVHVDIEAAKRMQAVWEGRKRPLYPDARIKRISKQLIERAKPHVLRDHLKTANAARNALLSCEQRSEIARKAAKSRWRKKRRRACAIARPIVANNLTG